MNLNRATLIGRITKDPELKKLPSGSAVAKFSVATNHRYKDKDGKLVETAQFHNCVAFGKLAEIISKYFQKGQEIFVEGRIEYRNWEKKDGGKGYSTEIIVDKFDFGQKPKNGKSEELPDGELPEEEIKAGDIDL